MDPHQQAASYADRIEEELHNLKAWQSEPVPDSAYASDKAFFTDTMTLFQWLQFVLVARIREIVEDRGAFPPESWVAAHAMRELDGFAEGGNLIGVLSEFDDFIEDLHRSRRKHAPQRPAGKIHLVPARERVPEPEPEPVPEALPPEAPAVVAERYWRTLDPRWLNTHPHAMPSQDVQLAENVFRTAVAFIEFPSEAVEIAEGVVLDTVIQAERGPWLIQTVLSKDGTEWRIDLPLSLRFTTMMFLGQNLTHAPYTAVNDARGRAMQFWQHVANYRDDWARELLLRQPDEIPHFSQGQIDEFFWYLSHTERDGAAIVRVLMNTQRGNRTWLTHMVQHGGAWFVDLDATLAASPGAQSVDG